MVDAGQGHFTSCFFSLDEEFLLNAPRYDKEDAHGNA